MIRSTRTQAVRSWLGIIAAVAVLALALTPAHLATAAAPAPSVRTASLSSVSPCGTRLGHPARIAHVIWLWMENQPYDAIIGSAQAPYINRLAAQCGLATNYHNITHPSAPEYIAATSGYTGGIADCSPDQCPDTNPSLFEQVSHAGKTWRMYAESMSATCENSFTDRYDVNHNPPVYYPALHAQCQRFDVPMGTPQQGAFASDLASHLPSFAFIAPNLIHDTHNSTVAVGDQYLQELVPRILNSGYYHAGTTALIIAWDEGEGGTTNDCAYNTTDSGCHVATVVVSPYTRRGTRSGMLFNHYSLLKTTEQLLGLSGYLGHANDPVVQSMWWAFGL